MVSFRLLSDFHLSCNDSLIDDVESIILFNLASESHVSNKIDVWQIGRHLADSAALLWKRNRFRVPDTA